MLCQSDQVDNTRIEILNKLVLDYENKKTEGTIMDIKNQDKNEPTEIQKQTDELSSTESNPMTNEELNKEKPVKRKRRQATEEQLNNPLHGVKLAQILEHLVAHYSWEYLAEHVNIRCFRYNPTMKSSLGFLRKTPWARDQVKQLYLEMLKEE